MIRQIVSWVSALFHPADNVLVMLNDAELRDKSRERSLSHLENCGRCQERVSQIAHEWKIIAQVWRADADAAGADRELAEIQSTINSWITADGVPISQPSQPFAQTPTGRQVSAVLGIYLGHRAAAALLEAGGAAPRSRQQYLMAADTALTALLGRKGAAAVGAKLLRIMDQFSESVAQSPLA
ncbi:MAG TPA: hypothetical protein VE398_11805 [Acidobacteriota bacterium]|nr:hypothetical protein [Acidobacteriota bacterium]